MNKLSMIAIGIAASLALSAPAQAKSKHHYYEGHDHARYYDAEAAAHAIDRRQARQSRRIAGGIDSGELTKREAKKLRKQQRRIAAIEREYCDDNYLSRKESAHLNRMLDKASDRIYALKHNDATRYYSRHGGDYGHRDSGYGHDDIFANSDFHRREVGVVWSW